MSKEIKKLMIDSLAAHFREVSECVIVDISGLDSSETVDFRNDLRSNDIAVKGVKGTLAKQAFAGSDLEPAGDILKGHSYVATGASDVVALAKSLVKWAKDNEKVVIKGAVHEGKALDSDGVTSLSKLPSREELLASIVQLALSPGAQIAGQLAGPGSSLAGQVKAHVENLEKSA